MSIIYGKQDPPEVAAAKVARLRAEGKLPPQGAARTLAAKYRDPSKVQIEAVDSGIGDRLKQKFAAMGVRMSKGCRCEKLRQQLNSLTPEQVLAKLDHFTDRIFANIEDLEGLIGFAAKAAAKLLPSLGKRRIRRTLEVCCREAKSHLSAATPDRHESEDPHDPNQSVEP